MIFCASTRRRKTASSLDGQSLALVGPFERRRHAAIVIVDEGENLGFQFLNGNERAAFEQFADQTAQPDFNLIHPGTVFGRVMKHDFVGRFAEERGPARHRGQNTARAFDAQVQVQRGKLCHPRDQGCRLMGIEIVTDDMKAQSLRVGRTHCLHMGQEIGFGARGATGGGHHFSRDPIAAQDKSACAMPDIFKFPPLDFAWGQW